MQLSKIKIAGFKSFVDPTTLQLPSTLVAIVGPNGCGKSNIIDAVTWVMGESSPKYLRGESLTDVIFNGSSARKPVGQASVELIFDNSDGTIAGEYAQYSEISVKRLINRDSDSSYFLNGVRCRKRDVVDIFLGTGLGPRSYSIIGQNMINRIIEAKPDDLRTYLEEAAGISKYKERRHETELRIQHTKENLARVNDVCAELEKQLSHLKHQANVAEKFKTLKQQERVLRARFYAIQWRMLDSQMVDYTLQIQREETGFEARSTEVSRIDRDLEQLRHEERTAQDVFQEIQRRYYAVGNEITRFEQDILHHQERQEQWENDLKQTQTDWQTIKNQMEESDARLRELEHQIQTLEPALLTAKKEVDVLQNDVSELEDELEEKQNNWDEFNQLSAKTTQSAQVEKANIQHLEQQISFTKKRLEQLELDQKQFNFPHLNDELKTITERADQALLQLKEEEKKLQNTREEMATALTSQSNTNKELDQVRNELQCLRGQEASLKALQQTALGRRDNPTSSWVVKKELDGHPRLAEQIQVEKEWQLAAEKVLGFALQGICVDDLHQYRHDVDDFKSGNLCLISAKTSPTILKNQKGNLLIDKIQSSYPLSSLLSGIHVADSLEDALTMCETLAPHESVITKEGVWVNRSWLKVLRVDDPASGVFEREQALKELKLKIETLQKTQSDLETNQIKYRETLQRLENDRDRFQQIYNKHQAEFSEFTMQKKLKHERLVELQTRFERYKKENEENKTQLARAEEALTESRRKWEKAVAELNDQSDQRSELIAVRDQVRQALQAAHQRVEQKKQTLHEIEIKFQTALSQKGASQQALSRLQSQLATLNDRKINLQSELSSMPALDSIKKALSRSLDKHVSIEAELNAARNAVDTLNQEFRNLESSRQTIERDIGKIRTVLETLRIEWQGWKVKTDSLVEQLKETEFSLEEILKELPPEVKVEECQANLEQVTNRINRLGPINLMAIEEYSTCAERKQYLDKQLEDLHAGLATLEDAIAKIDKETKTRFKETFDKVNQRFQELFPTIFGGGKAYLELTSDDLLQAGISMMACPPGKRNSNIYLLSGGEKSLTAIALIFSIFHLNPAPFCLLDEVDAALDDTNVLRFTRLMKVMSDKTQFLFISHNKISIEMAQHLIGVTMSEPGVSRLVSVDIEKAMSLAGTG